MKKLLLILLCLPLLFTTCKKEDEFTPEDTTTNTPLSTDGEQTYVPDDNFENYLEDNGMGNGIANDDDVALSNINTVNNLWVLFKNISDLTGIEDFGSLQFFDCSNNNLTNLDVSNNTQLLNLFCEANILNTLSFDVGLTSLHCDNNQLTSLDVSANIALTELHCRDNQLNTLDVNQNISLIYLNCGENQLTNLYVSQNTALTYLWCYSNQLTSLDVSNNTALTELYCYSNLLTTLDVSNNTALTSLSCRVNQLTSLNVSGATTLTTLNCQENQLTSLDMSNNSALTVLWCGDNQLTSLDMRGVDYKNIKNQWGLVGSTNVLTNDFKASNNPNLYCISVDDVAYSEEWWRDRVGGSFEELATDAHCSFSENCP